MHVWQTNQILLKGFAPLSGYLGLQQVWLIIGVWEVCELPHEAWALGGQCACAGKCGCTSGRGRVGGPTPGSGPPLHKFFACTREDNAHMLHQAFECYSL